jgi:hypothetical protein
MLHNMIVGLGYMDGKLMVDDKKLTFLTSRYCPFSLAILLAIYLMNLCTPKVVLKTFLCFCNQYF